MNPIMTTQDVVQVLPCLHEKFVVDLANGVDIVRDHTRTQQSQRFFERLWHDLTGTNAQRQQAINASLADGVDSSLRWLIELTGSLAKSHYAITQVNDRVNQLVHHTAEIAHYAAETRSQLHQFAENVNTRCLALEQEVQGLRQTQDGMLHLNRVFTRWQAGRYPQFSLAGRCYAVIEALRWGAFGDLLRSSDASQHNVLIDDLRDRAITQMLRDADVTASERKNSDFWLAVPDTHFGEGLAYLGDWCDPHYHPVVSAITQTDQVLPLGMPIRSTAERLASAMVDEVFGGVQP
ncbi:conserved hypothetical protein [Enterobacterales bacterium 8AC]|nr:conserved hypothetical protein [Enterobacterales bacterium 8AC]